MSSKGDKKGGKGGRGHFRRERSFKPKYQSKPRSKELKFTPLDSKNSVPQATYASVMEAIENDILKNFEKGAKDVADSLLAEEKIQIPKPKLQVSRADKEPDVLCETEEFKIEYGDQIKRYNSRVQALEEGLHKASVVSSGLTTCPSA